MMQDPWNISAPTGIWPSKSAACSPIRPIVRPKLDSFPITHKVPVGDTPYVEAKRVQLVDKDPEKAIVLFWAAISAADRVDSALKDMAIVIKQQNRAEEAIEAIKLLRNRCSDEEQELLDNILLDLYKGNPGWALMQKDNYVEAEPAYRRALQMGPDNNKMCNLGICLMKQGQIAEAKETLRQVSPAAVDSLRGADSHLKAYERAQEMLHDLEAKFSGHTAKGRPDQSSLFDAFVESSSIWQPHPCIDCLMPARECFADENTNVNRISTAKLEFSSKAVLDIGALLFYSSRMMKDLNGINHQLHDPMCNLKRTRSGNVMEKSLPPRIPVEKTSEQGNRRKSLCVVGRERIGGPNCRTTMSSMTPFWRQF